MRGFLTTALCVAVALVAGCGDGGSGQSSREMTGETPGPTGAGLPSGCRPAQIKALLTGLLAAVESNRERVALSYVADPPELIRFALYAGPEPGQGRLDPRTPSEFYAGLSLLTRSEGFALLGAMVGRVAPRAGERSGPRADNPAAGVDFVFTSKRRSISGKVGVDCSTGQIYTGAMGARPGLGSRMICGRRLRLNVDEPVVCAYNY